VAFLSGLTFETVLKAMGSRTKKAYLVAFLALAIVVNALLYLALKFLGLPGLELFVSTLAISMVIIYTEQIIGMLVAFKVWDRIKTKSFVRI
jgi:hypothetical protein